MRSVSLSTTQKAALGALTLAIILVFIHWSLALIPIALLLIIFLIAPFMHRSSFFLPVISQGRRDAETVALTFDDGPDPMTTPQLLNLLMRFGVHATFFLTGRRAKAYPELVRAIVREGHALGNHSYAHNPFLIFSGKERLFKDIAVTQHILTRLGSRPEFYRPPVGITYPGLGAILTRLQLQAVNFSCRANDRGNKKINQISRRILNTVRAGDIIMLHDLKPAHGRMTVHWLSQIEDILIGIKTKGLAIEPLSALIGKVKHIAVESGKTVERASFTKEC